MKPGTLLLQLTRLLDQVSERICYMHYSLKTEKGLLALGANFYPLDPLALGP